MQRIKKFEDSIWLILGAVLIFAIGFIFKKPSFETSGLDLIFWGVLSGTLYALTNANDKRAINGRKAIGIQDGTIVDESPVFSSELSYMALGSVFAIPITWISLLILYNMFGPQLNYQFSNILRDLRTVFELKFSLAAFPGVAQVGLPALQRISEISIPYSFLFTGIFTIFLTFSTFKIFQSAGLDYFARWLAVQMIASLLIGVFLLGEKISFHVIVIICFLILFFSLTSRLKPESSHKSGNPRMWGIIFLIFALLRDLFIRGSLWEFDGAQRIFTAFCFRAAYFTVFLLVPLWILLTRFWNKSEKKSEASGDIRSQISQKQFLLPFTTAFILVLVFTLQTPVVASSLALGSLSLQVGNILVVSFVGLFYKTEGSTLSLASRFSETFLRQENGVKKYYYIISYFLFLLTALYWIYYSFVHKL